MGKIGKISVIPKEYSQTVSMENSLRNYGYNRFPGAALTLFPSRKNDGSYRTGLDENDRSIQSLPKGEIRDAKIKEIIELRNKLETALNINLSPRSDYYNFSSNAKPKVSPVKLKQNNIFNLDDPLQAVTYAWLSVHPAIAPSLEAFQRGDVSPETEYFVNDDEVENRLAYSKKKELNDALSAMGAMSLEKRRKIARLMDLPYTDDTKEEVVYNGLDNLLRTPEISDGQHKGASPIRIFNMYLTLSADSLDVRDIVDQAIKDNIYRIKKGGKIYEGELLAWDSKEALIEHLLDEKNQVDRLELEKKLKIKKLASV